MVTTAVRLTPLPAGEGLGTWCHCPSHGRVEAEAGAASGRTAAAIASSVAKKSDRTGRDAIDNLGLGGRVASPTVSGSRRAVKVTELGPTPVCDGNYPAVAGSVTRLLT